MNAFLCGRLLLASYCMPRDGFREIERGTIHEEFKTFRLKRTKCVEQMCVKNATDCKMETYQP